MAVSPPASGAPAVFVHVGEPKTGTTYLQQVMWANRTELEPYGVIVPGARPMTHWRAAQDLREIPQIPNDPAGPNAGAWERLVRDALAAPRVAVISHELLAAASAEQAARGVRSLAGAEVHVVLTVRDFGTLVPAEWQETVKHRNTKPWHQWVADVLDHEAADPDRRRFLFWRMHDTLDILRSWGALLPPDHVHVITVPPRGTDRDLLWQRFAGVIGVDPAVADTSRVRNNASLGLGEVELLRRLNEALPAELPDWFYMRNVKDVLAHGALAGLPRFTGPLELPPDRHEQAQKHAEEIVAGLRAGGYDVVGDLGELLPRPISDAAVSPDDVTADQMLGPAVTAMTALLVELARTQGITVGGEAGTRYSRPAGLLKRRFLALSQRSPAAFRIRRTYWHVANAARQLRATSRPGAGPDGPPQ